MEMTAPIPIKEESDEDLLTAILCKDDDPTGAARALEQLYSRYAPRLMGLAMNESWEGLGLDPDFLVSETFVKVWEKAETFKSSGQKLKDGTDAGACFWIFEIFKNLRIDALKHMKCRPGMEVCEPSEIQLQLDSKMKSPSANGELDEVPASERLQQVRNWLDSKSPAEKDLMLTSAEYVDCGTGKCHIPANILEGLAANMGTLPQSLKVKRQRLKEDLKNFLENTER